MNRTTVENYRFFDARRSGDNSSGWYGPLTPSVTSKTVTSSVNFVPERNSDWKSKIASGKSATSIMEAVRNQMFVSNSDHTLTKHKFKDLPNYYVWEETAGCFSYPEISLEAGDPSPFIIESVRNQAKIQIVSQIIQAQTSLKGLVTAGEMGETVRMVNGAGKELYHGVRTFLSDVSSNSRRWVRYVTPQGLARAIGKRWLEYAFGWRPLVADIDDGMKAIARFQSRRLPYVQVRVSPESAQNVTQPRYEISRSWYRFAIQPKLQYRYGYRIYGAVGVQNPGLGSLAHEFGFEPHQFVPTLWELIPFSFLADYFVNIGAVINGLSFNSSAVLWLNFGELRECEAIHEHAGTRLVSSPSWIPQETVVYLGPPFRHKRSYKLRGIQSLGHLVPSLEFGVPGTSTKWANIFALRAQAIDTSRRVRSFT